MVRYGRTRSTASAPLGEAEQERPTGMDRDRARATLDDATCRVQQVIPTATIFAAALERLNRKSSMALFQELAQKLDDHDRRLDAAEVALAAQQRRARRACLRGLLLALLLAGLCFLLGLYTMRRLAPVQCAPACSSATAAGLSVPAPAPATASAMAIAPSLQSESAQAAMDLAQIKDDPQTSQLAISGQRRGKGADFPAGQEPSGLSIREH